MHQQSQQVERRPRPRTRRSDDGSGTTIEQILARHVPDAVMCLVGCACVALPIAFGVAGTAWWPFVIAYGGCLVGIAASGVVGR